jgi:hypothetical protein
VPQTVFEHVFVFASFRILNQKILLVFFIMVLFARGYYHDSSGLFIHVNGMFHCVMLLGVAEFAIFKWEELCNFEFFED